MQTGDASLADENFDLLVNNTMYTYIDPARNLVDFTSTLATPMGKYYGALGLGLGLGLDLG